MALGFWSWTGGTVQVEVTSAALSGTLSAMERAGIFPKDVQRTGELTLQFFIRRKDFAALQNLCGKRGEELTVLGKYGLFWPVKELLHRPILVIGMLSLLLLSLWVPGRVFFVFVQGNENVPSNLILEQASQCGIGFGA